MSPSVTPVNWDRVLETVCSSGQSWVVFFNMCLCQGHHEVYVCLGIYGEVIGHPAGVGSLPPSVSWGLNSDHQALRQTPLPTGPSAGPTKPF